MNPDLPLWYYIALRFINGWSEKPYRTQETNLRKGLNRTIEPESNLLAKIVHHYPYELGANVNARHPLSAIEVDPRLLPDGTRYWGDYREPVPIQQKRRIS